MSERPPKSLQDLDDRLKRLRADSTPLERTPAVNRPVGGYGMAFAISAHLVAGLAVGAGIGLLLDKWLGTSPWLFLVFFFLGAGSGVLNVYRTVSGMDMAMGYRPAPKEDKGQDDEKRGRNRRPNE